MFPRILTWLLMSAILFVMNVLVLHRFIAELTWLVSLIIALLFPFGYLLEKEYGAKWTSILYRVGVAWFESSWLLLVFVGIAYVLELLGLGFRELDASIIALWIAFTGLGLLYAKTWKTTELIIPTEKVRERITFVQLTDVHAFGAYAKTWVADAIERAKALEPDFIVLTGDIIDEPSVPKKDVFAITSDIPLLYTLGNHEFYVGDTVAAQRTTKGSMHLLRKQATMVSGINVIGLDDHHEFTYLETALTGLVKKDCFNLLLFHRPRGMKYAAAAGVDMMLSGHTHGGVNFPMHIFISAVYGKYYRGLHRIKQMILYTSNGSGTYNWPLRLFNPQEIVKITLVPK